MQTSFQSVALFNVCSHLSTSLYSLPRAFLKSSVPTLCFTRVAVQSHLCAHTHTLDAEHTLCAWTGSGTLTGAQRYNISPNILCASACVRFLVNGCKHSNRQPTRVFSFHKKFGAFGNSLLQCICSKNPYENKGSYSTCRYFVLYPSVMVPLCVCACTLRLRAPRVLCRPAWKMVQRVTVHMHEFNLQSRLFSVNLHFRVFIAVAGSLLPLIKRKGKNNIYSNDWTWITCIWKAQW